jgi:hypothetical protein
LFHSIFHFEKIRLMTSGKINIEAEEKVATIFKENQSPNYPFQRRAVAASTKLEQIRPRHSACARFTFLLCNRELSPEAEAPESGARLLLLPHEAAREGADRLLVSFVSAY